MRLAFVGRMGSGKTTAAKIFVEEGGFEKVSLAAKLKQVAEVKNLPEGLWHNALIAHAWDVIPDPVYQMAVIYYTHPRTDISMPMRPIDMLVHLWQEDLRESEDTRELFQRLGTDSGRFIKPAIWIDHFARHLKDSDAVADDLRFVNEEEALRDLGFLIVKTTMPEETRRERLKTRDGFFVEARQGHASETELEDITPDVLVHNTGTVEDLRKMLFGPVMDIATLAAGRPSDEIIELHPNIKAEV